MADVCDALGLDAGTRVSVLGADGEKALAEIVETRFSVRPEAQLNDRQTKALAHARQLGAINLSTYRQLCPGLSDETLRRDLADLVQSGLLVRNGRNKGMNYTLAT